MARVKYPFSSPSVSGTLITSRTTPPRGTRRRRFNKKSSASFKAAMPRGSMAGPLIFTKNGYVYTPSRVWYDQKF